ncbi:MAG: hypothetical protein AB8V10_04250 [Francisella endosymbiont of Hyalomma asiaticum]
MYILFINVIGLVIFGSIFYYSAVLLTLKLIDNIFMGLVAGVASNYAIILFSPGVRSSGLSFSYNISFAILNGTFLALASLGITKGFIFTSLYLILAVIIISILLS